VLALAVAVTAGAPHGAPAQTAKSASRLSHPTPHAAALTFAGRTLDDWIRSSLDDTSLYRRDRAISALRRAPAPTRLEAVRQFTLALNSPAGAARPGGSTGASIATNGDRRARSLQAMGQLAIETQGQVGSFDGANDLVPAVPAVARIAGDAADPLRASALWLLAEAGRRAREQSLPVARQAVRDPDLNVREPALSILGAAGDSTDVPRIGGALEDRSWDVRIAAANALGNLGRREAVPVLMRVLSDTSRVLRATAIRSLARLGPMARSALPTLALLVTDSTNWRGEGSYAETIGAEAAWAVTRINPRRGVGMIPARVDIDDREAALKGDGLGTYVAGADSIKAYVSAALNLDLSGPRGDGRTTGLAYVRKLPRTLSFDLSKPAPGGGGKPLGLVRDNEAVIHIFWKRERGKRMVSITTLDPVDAAVECERAEFEFRVNGKPYLLQMGEWVDAEFNPKAPKVTGAGTTPPRIWHLNADEWTVIASPGSKARLWDMTDPSRPVDRGLYLFPFAITWAQMLPR
jgi:hypothetical protein